MKLLNPRKAARKILQEAVDSMGVLALPWNRAAIRKKNFFGVLFK